MHWEDSLITAGIAFITIPLTTFFSLWIKWWFNNPKIKCHFTSLDDSGEMTLNPKLSNRRYDINKLTYIGGHIPIPINKMHFNESVSEKEKNEFKQDNKWEWHRFSYGNAKIWISKNRINKLSRIRQLIY